MRPILGIVFVAACGFGGGSDGGDDVVGPPDARPDAPPLPPPTSPRKLTFNNTTGAALSNFPVMVSLTPAEVDYAMVADPTRDLRFFDGQTNLDFDIDTWNKGGESIIWVRVPQIDTGATDSIEMRFGPDVGTGTVVNRAAVWTSKYLAVNHMAATLKNVAAVDTMFDGTATDGATQKVGQIGNGVGFPGQVQFNNGGMLFNGSSAFTLEMWLRPNYPSSTVTGMPPVADKGTSLTGGRLSSSGNFLLYEIDFHYMTGTTIAQSTAITTLQWNYLVYTFDGNIQKLYLNGVEKQSNSPPVATSLLTSTSQFVLGGAASMDGAIDELRISTEGHPVSWVLANYLSMTRQFVTFSAP